MLYGIFGDIHGNLEALDTVLAAMREAGVTHYLCLGDVVGYGANPNECMDRIRDLDARLVAGNHDWAAIGRLDTTYFNPYARMALNWCRDRLAKTHQEYLDKTPLTEVIDEKLTIFHSTLHDPEYFGYLLSRYEAAESFTALQSQVGFFGHSHIPMVFMEQGSITELASEGTLALESDARYLINPGSVGQPRDSDPRAAYALFDPDAGEVRMCRLPYDVNKAAEKIVAAGLPPLFAERLRVGV